MKLLHSIASVMIGFAALSAIAPTQAIAERVINIDPAISAALRFGRYSSQVAQRVADFEAQCIAVRDQLATDLAGTSVRAERRQLVKTAKQELKELRDLARADISALAADTKGVLGVHPAGVALFTAIDDVRNGAIRDVNALSQAYTRECQALLR